MDGDEQVATITVNGSDYVASSWDGAGGVMFGGVGARYADDDRAYIFTQSGRPSSMWPAAVRVSDRWFRTQQCVSEGI